MAQFPVGQYFEFVISGIIITPVLIILLSFAVRGIYSLFDDLR